MDPLFTTTTVLLTEDYVQMFAPLQLISKLSKVRSVTGIRFSKANTTYALSGTWEQVNEAFFLLERWFEHPKDEPSSVNDDHTDVFNGFDAESTADLDILQHVMVEDGLSAVKITDTGDHHDNVRQSDDNCSHHASSEISAQKEDNYVRPKHKQNHSKEHGNQNVTYLTDSSLQEEKQLKADKAERGDVGPTDAEANVKNRKSSKKRCRENGICRSPDVTKQRTTRNSSKVLTGLSVDECESKVNNKRKGKTGDKESKQSSRNIGIISTEAPVKGEPRKTRVLKKPGEKGYWSRVRIISYNEKHTCDKCGVILKSRKRYMEHLRRVHIKEYQCDICLRGFGYPTDLHRHKCPGFPDPENKFKSKGGRPKSNKPKVQLSLPCPECDYVGTTQKHLNGHIRRNHRLTFSCDICLKKFGFERDLERHKLNVHSDTSYFCDRCSKFYKSKPVFESHLKTHEKGYVKPKFACEVCSKFYTTKYGLNVHNKMEHLGIKREYLCQVCGKKFTQRNSYKQHMNAHYGVKPYVCDVCGKGFTYHKSLKEHKYMHDNIRRFQCNLCEKAFRQRTILQIHMKVHKTVKDHICSRCGKGFSQKQALERHERIHSGIKPYTCIPCQRTFGDASTIRRHMQAIHQKTVNNWRDDIVCNVKSKTDYYVLGGSGQNRTFKSKSKPENSKENHEIPSVNTTKEDSSPQTSLVQPTQPPREINPADYKADYNITDLNPVQSNMNLNTGTDIQATTLYDISSGQPNTLNVNYSNSSLQVSDFINLPNSLSHIQSVNKIILEPNSLGHLEQQIQESDLQTNSVFSESLLPGSAVNSSKDQQRLMNQSTTNHQNSSETVLNQTLASLWGIMGYPPHYTSNLTAYQGTQNQ